MGVVDPEERARLVTAVRELREGGATQVLGGRAQVAVGMGGEPGCSLLSESSERGEPPRYWGGGHR